jgi:hypothetical protein
MVENNGVKKAQPFTKRQKKIAVYFAIFSLAVIVFMIMQIRYSINSPFMAPKGYADYLAKQNQPATSTQGIDYNNVDCSNGAISSPDNLVLRNTDTDGDGLSDYDELCVYHTSPYLADTDSDGFTDGEEVKNGTDPNCATGKVCSTPLSNLSVTASSSSVTIDPNSFTPAEALAFQGVLNGGSDTTALRQLLISNGVDTSTINAMSDADLLAAVNNASSTPASAPVDQSTSIVASSTSPTSQAILNGTADLSVIRKMMIDNGANKDAVNALSDADLQAAYQATLNK